MKSALISLTSVVIIYVVLMYISVSGGLEMEVGLLDGPMLYFLIMIYQKVTFEKKAENND